MRELLTVMDTKYKRLEYIEFTGTQYIDTGFKANQDTRVVTEFSATSISTQFVFSSRIGANNKAFACNIYSSKIRADYNDVYKITNISVARNVFYKIDFNKNNFYVDGNLEYTFDYSNFQSTNNMFLGCNESLYYYFNGMLKATQIYDNGTLVRNFIPVLRKSDNEIGMLDLVEGKFYPNAGTGKFTANLDTMYAIIQGSPTQSPYGVFSGFSASNYLQTSTKLTNETNFEFSITFTMPSTSLTNTLERLFMLSSGRNGLDIYTANGVSHPHAYLKNINNQDYSFNMLSVNLEPNKTYTTKLIKQNTTYILECWSNGVKIGSETHSDDDININDFYYFSSTQSDRIFEGSIDLNNSYIKINSTKYKLQAVVGYTVVGSPTITDGVVSGFSSANYLQIAQSFPSISSINKVKEQVVFTTGTIGTQQMIMGGDYGAGTFGFELRTNGKLMFRVTFIDVNNATKYAEVQCDTILTEGTKYKAIGKFDLSNLSVNLELYNENNVLIDTKTYTISSSSFNALNTVGNYYLGNHWNRGVFTGSIYLNNTDIVINNKLWFNGQQA